MVGQNAASIIFKNSKFLHLFKANSSSNKYKNWCIDQTTVVEKSQIAKVKRYSMRF